MHCNTSQAGVPPEAETVNHVVHGDAGSQLTRLIYMLLYQAHADLLATGIDCMYSWQTVVQQYHCIRGQEVRLWLLTASGRNKCMHFYVGCYLSCSSSTLGCIKDGATPGGKARLDA